MEVPIADKIQLKISELALLLGQSEPTVKKLLNDNKQECKEFVRFTDGRSQYKILRKPFEKWYTENYRRLVG